MGTFFESHKRVTGTFLLSHGLESKTLMVLLDFLLEINEFEKLLLIKIFIVWDE